MKADANKDFFLKSIADKIEREAKIAVLWVDSKVNSVIDSNSYFEDDSSVLVKEAIELQNLEYTENNGVFTITKNSNSMREDIRDKLIKLTKTSESTLDAFNNLEV